MRTSEKMSAATKLEEAEHVLLIIRLDEDQIKYITKTSRIRTLIKLKKMKEDAIKDFIGGAVGQLNRAEADSISDFQMWYREYIKKGGQDVRTDFTKEQWEKFDTDEVSSVDTPTVDNGVKGSIKISLSDYKILDGTYKGWRVHKRQFTATANDHGYGEFVASDYKISEPYDQEYSKYEKGSKHIYNTLE